VWRFWWSRLERRRNIINHSLPSARALARSSILYSTHKFCALRIVFTGYLGASGVFSSVQALLLTLDTEDWLEFILTRYYFWNQQEIMNLVNCLALFLVWHAHSVSKLPVPVVMSLSSSGVRVSIRFHKGLHFNKYGI